MKNEIVSLRNNQDYKKWYQSLKGKIKSSQIKAVTRVNTELLTVYWEIGKEIVEKQKQSNWGDLLIEQLSNDLSAEFATEKGFSRRNLFYIQKWYLFYYQGLIIAPQVVALFTGKVGGIELVQQLVGLIPWGHNRK